MFSARAFASLVALCVSTAFAGPLDQGNIAVVQDTTGVIHNGSGGGGFQEPLQSRFCKETAKSFFQSHGDDFDGLVTFTPKSLDTFENVQQGTPVRLTATGLGHASSWNFTSQYGSAGKLSQCVFMASLTRLPNNPDAYAPGPFGLPFGLTGVELVGHEYGHHWLMAANFDKGNGEGAKDFLRGYESDSPNYHYSAYADSRSVMYGSFITDNGNGSFTLNGGDRKYSQFDQYLMGLRQPSEVAPMMVVNDGSDHGSPAVAQQKNSTQSVSGTRVDVTIDDLIRANGQRTPSVTNAQKCWRVAFVLVTEGSNTPTAQDVQKVEAYRARFTSWFSWATDGRGTMDTRLTGSGCLSTAVVTPDAGTVTPSDAGVVAAQDGGVAADGGVTEEPTGGENPGPGAEQSNELPPAYDKDNIGKLRPGCGCGSAPGIGAFLFVALAFMRRRRGH